MVQLVECN